MDMAVYSAIKDLENISVGKCKTIDTVVTYNKPYTLIGEGLYKKISVTNKNPYSNLKVYLDYEISIFNKDTITAGKYVSESTGQLSTDSNFNSSDYIEIEGNTKYIKSNNLTMAFYDVNKIFINSNKDMYIVTSPENARYARISIRNTEKLSEVYYKKYTEQTEMPNLDVRPLETITIDTVVSSLSIYTDFCPCDVKITLNGIFKTSDNIAHTSKFNVLNKIVFHARGSYILATTNDKKTLQLSKDAGKTWIDLLTEDTINFMCGHIGYNFILAFDNQGKIRISEDDGATFVNCDTSNISPFYNPFYHGIDSNYNNVVFAEYATNTGNYRIFKSSDRGKTWNVTLTKVNPTEIRHFHSVNYNNNIGKWIVTSGDENNQVRWFMSSDGNAWTEIEGVHSQRYRTLNVYDVSYDEIMWASDCKSGTRAEILKAKVNDIANTTEVVHALNGTGWGLIGCGSEIIAVTSIEPTDVLNKQPSIYLSKDSGKTWNCIMRNSIVKNQTTGGFKSVLGVLEDGSFVVGLNYLEGQINTGYNGHSVIIMP